MRIISCSHCSTEIESIRPTQKYCSNRCKTAAKYAANKDKYQKINRDWKRENLDRKHHARVYASERLPEIQRVIRLINRITEEQKPVLADWLLTIGHLSLRTHAVDEFVANYNTARI